MFERRPPLPTQTPAQVLDAPDKLAAEIVRARATPIDSVKPTAASKQDTRRHNWPVIANNMNNRLQPERQHLDRGQLYRISKTADGQQHAEATASADATARHSRRAMKSRRARIWPAEAPRGPARAAASKRLGVRQLIGAQYLLQLSVALLVAMCCAPPTRAQQQQPLRPVTQATTSKLPDLVSSTSDEPISAVVGQDAFLSCVAKNLQNYTIIWRFTNNAAAAATSTNQADDQTSSNRPDGAAPKSNSFADDLGQILTAGRQRVTSDERVSVINSHDTWLLKISNVKPSDTGTYICYTNSEPQVRVARILSVIKPSSASESEGGCRKIGAIVAGDCHSTGCRLIVV